MSHEDEKVPGDDSKPVSQWKCFVGGLSWQMKDEDLKEAFAKYDPTGAEIILDKHTARPRGFGFVHFKDALSMQDAIRDMHEKELEGRKISVVRAVPQEQTKPGTPAAVLGGGTGARRDDARRGGYGDRYSGGYGGRDGYRGGSSYDRGGYGGYGGYDRRVGGGYGGYGSYGPSYGGYGGYDRGGYASDPRYAAYSRDSYGRDSYAARDPYARSDPYASSAAYGSGYGHERAYDSSAAYDSRYSSYDDRGAGGPDRRGYASSAAPRSGPYERPVERRPPADARR